MEEIYPAELEGGKQISVNRSAFEPFSSIPRRNFARNNHQSSNKRLIEFLRRQWTWPRNELDRERSHRHMMNERTRRENQKQRYMALHSVLPNGTKSDKHSIVQIADQRIRELQREEEELRRRNMELQWKLEAETEEKRIRVKLENPTSGIDSLLSLLQYLKSLGIKVCTLRSNLSAKEFSAEVVTQTQVVDDQNVEKAMWSQGVENMYKYCEHFSHMNRN